MPIPLRHFYPENPLHTMAQKVKEDPLDYEIFVETVYVDEQGRKLVPVDQQYEVQTKPGKKAKKVKKKKARKYKWAFFLASMFTGIGVTAVTDFPLFLFLGMGLGFLFFADPVYDRVVGALGSKTKWTQIE